MNLKIASINCARALALLPAIVCTAGCNILTPSAHEGSTRHVRLLDLDLTKAAGRRVADERIRQAAEVVCDRVADIDDLGIQIHERKCIDSVVAQATESLRQQIAQRQASQLAQSQDYW